MERELTSSEVDFFLGIPDLLPVYLSLRAQLTDLAPACEIRVHKTMVSFRAPRPFAYVSILPKSRAKDFSRLLLSFSMKAPLRHPLVMDSVYIRQDLYTIHAHVPIAGTIDRELMDCVQFSLLSRNKNVR